MYPHVLMMLLLLLEVRQHVCTLTFVWCYCCYWRLDNMYVPSPSYGATAATGGQTACMYPHLRMVLLLLLEVKQQVCSLTFMNVATAIASQHLRADAVICRFAAVACSADLPLSRALQICYCSVLFRFPTAACSADLPLSPDLQVCHCRVLNRKGNYIGNKL